MKSLEWLSKTIPQDDPYAELRRHSECYIEGVKALTNENPYKESPDRDSWAKGMAERGRC